MFRKFALIFGSDTINALEFVSEIAVLVLGVATCPQRETVDMPQYLQSKKVYPIPYELMLLREYTRLVQRVQNALPFPTPVVRQGE